MSIFAILELYSPFLWYNEKMTYIITGNENIPFNNNAFYCVGTGRMGLALQKQYFEQLKFVQEKIGFEHIRGHGLFHDDMAIYHEWQDGDKAEVEYNWTYLDMVMDSYKELNIKPFIELGFMPKELSTGDNHVFYWKGNTTPPTDYKKWAELIKATLRHLMERYGAEEAVKFPVEVWNEPNLPGFWKNADMQEYFKLYEVSSRAVKEVDERFCVGGPAVCGGTDQKWIKAFLEYVRDNACPLDFVSRHHYTTELPTNDGHYGYPKLHPKEKCFEQLESTRDIVDSFPEFKGMEINVTEFNTSYIPNAPVHDTNLNAAYIALMLSTFGDNHKSYSYWTFGDIFEECGVPYSLFHGGFGLVANGCIPRPTFWTFAFYKELTKKYDKCVFRNENCVVVKCKDGSFKGVAWNIDEAMSGKELELELDLPLEDDKSEKNVLVTKLVDEDVCNPLKVWHELGEHKNPSKEELDLIRESAQPFVQTKRIGKKVKLTLKENAVCYFEAKEAPIVSDRGYTYGRLE